MTHKEFLQQVGLTSVVGQGKTLFRVSPEADLEDLLRLFKEKNILSAFVFDEETKEFVGSIDTLRVMRTIAYTSYLQQERQEERLGYYFKKQRVKDIMRKELNTVDGASSLMDAMNLLDSNELYRALVNHADGTHGNLSQMDVIRFLHQNSSRLGDVVKRTIEELQLVYYPDEGIVSVSTEHSAVEGYREIFEANISAAPVVNKEGVLVSTLSPSDLRGITSENLNRVLLPVLEFLGERAKAHPVTCKPSDSLEDVMSRAMTAKVHRVWIVNSAFHPIGVVSLTDMIGVFIDH